MTSKAELLILGHLHLDWSERAPTHEVGPTEKIIAAVSRPYRPVWSVVLKREAVPPREKPNHNRHDMVALSLDAAVC